VSQRNIELHRRFIEAYNTRDVEAFVACFDPDVEFHSAFTAVSGAVYRGRDELRNLFRDVEDAWDEIHIEPESYFDLGEHTLAFALLQGRGRHSGADVVMPFALVARWRDGLATSYRSYNRRADALSDLGVSETELEPIEPVSANLDLVRSIYADWERGDFSSADWAHPEIEFVVADGPEPGRWTGLARMAEAWRDVLSAWQVYRIKTDEYRELDGSQVLVLLHAVGGRGKVSGLELGQTRDEGANILHIRGGKVTRLVTYFDRDHALADLGLAPEGDSER
jgi:ketosteroid isomerase-like protein